MRRVPPIAWLALAAALGYGGWTYGPTVIDWARPEPKPAPSTLSEETRAAFVAYAHGVANVWRETEWKGSPKATGEATAKAEADGPRKAFKDAMHAAIAKRVGEAKPDEAWDAVRAEVAAGLEAVR